MKRLLAFILYLAFFAFASFLIMVVAIFNMGDGLGSVTWAVSTFVVGALLFKRWQKSYPKGKPQTPKWQGWEQVDRSRWSDDEDIDSSHDSIKQQFIPWHERDDLLWKGSRKLLIQYKSNKGEVTERAIEMKGIWPGDTGEIYFRAKCHLRNEWRTFKAGNVLHVINARHKEFDDFFSYMSEELGV